MKMKALLLGTGAAVAFAGAQAQAADLSIAEPVDYVRVCDAFGTGYWYIPGTDTCLRIGGFVRFEARFADGDDSVFFGGQTHDRDWEFFTRANLQVEARSMTDWGPLVSYIEFEADFTDADSGVGAADPTVEEAWLSLGPITAGYAQSNFDWGGGYTYEGFDGFFLNGALTDTKTNQIALSWAMNGFGIVLAVEDGENRSESWYEADSLAGDVPDLVAAITGEGQGWNAKLAFIYAPGNDNIGFIDDAWGVQGGVEFDVFGSDKFMLAASYLDNNFDVDVWSIMASYKHFWQSNLYSAVTAIYDDHDFFGEDWAVAFNTVYSPVENFSVGAEIQYVDGDNYDGDWAARIRLQRDFGG